jgi:UDP-N-acetyl-D-galactosamine dehydrogenase
VIVLGLTFKENCSDLRNSGVVGLVHELEEYGCEVIVHDPIADIDSALYEYGIRLAPWNELSSADALVAAVPHVNFLNTPINEILGKLRLEGIFIDVKSAFPAKDIISAGYKLWRL